MIIIIFYIHFYLYFCRQGAQIVWRRCRCNFPFSGKWKPPVGARVFAGINGTRLCAFRVFQHHRRISSFLADDDIIYTRNFNSQGKCWCWWCVWSGRSSPLVCVRQSRHFCLFSCRLRRTLWFTHLKSSNNKKDQFCADFFYIYKILLYIFMYYLRPVAAACF